MLYFNSFTPLAAAIKNPASRSFHGTHRGEIISGDLRGAVTANEVRFRSSHKYEGTRLSYDFSGKVEGDTMGGRVNLDEYGEARWTARRHKYS